jgi:hypothetical protein
MRRQLAGIVAVVTMCLAAAPAAADVPPGFDLFETDPEATVFSFRNEFTIPPGFFADGSQPFAGDVNFGGDPLNAFQGKDVGDADTIVRRLGPAPLAAPFPAQAFVPIEIAALNLVGVQPIVVQVGTQTQQWDVSAILSTLQPSRGNMRILQTSPQGGAFDAQLEVVPKFTFTRLSDGATRTLDTGLLPPQNRQNLILRADEAPWRAGCVAPALAVPGLNDGFCPALTPAGAKQLSILQSPRIRHGIRPAQPRLEHFKCYAARPATPFQPRRVGLVDQFGSGRAQVVAPLELCTPVRKNREPFVNKTDHLKCYGIRQAGFRRRNVAVRNQFGPAQLQVVAPSRLCLPSLKTRLSVRRAPRNTLATDHFKCYSVRGRPLRGKTPGLRDQFVGEQVVVGVPVLLCAPAQKNRVTVKHPVRHLVCYSIKARAPFRLRRVRVFNQFGVEVLDVYQRRSLCVPSLKVPL